MIRSLVTFFLFGFCGTLFAVEIYRDSFETDGEGVRYNSFFLGGAGCMVFERTNTNPHLCFSNAITGIDGTYAWFAEDSLGTIGLIGQLTLPNINITGFTNLQVALDAGVGLDDGAQWNTSNGFNVVVSIDGGAPTTIGQFRGDNPLGGDLREDTNFDETGEGNKLGTTVSNLLFTVPGTGSNLMIQVTVSTDNGEELAFDRFRVLGEPIGIDETLLVVNHATDTTDNNTWEELTGAVTAAGLERPVTNNTGNANPVLAQNPDTLLNIDNAYQFNPGAGNQVIELGSNNASNAYGDAPQFGDIFTDRNSSFEVWFRPAVTNGGRQILWEAGGGTGSSFTMIDDQLVFRTRSQNNARALTNDVSALILGGKFIQAVGTINLSNGAERIQLYVNGTLVGTSAIDTNTTLNDWSGADGDGIGGRGQANLGGFGNGYNHGGVYNTFDGEIAAFRIYQDTNAASQAGALLASNQVWQNYRAVAPDRVFFDDGDTNFINWLAATNWGYEGNAAADTPPRNLENVFIGGGFNVEVDTWIGETPNQIVLSHTEGWQDGAGDLTIVTNGYLRTARDLIVGSGGNTDGDLFLRGGNMSVGGDIVFGVNGNRGGRVTIFNDSTLTVAGEIRERVNAVNTAQIYLDGGTLDVAGDILPQSFRLGQNAGRHGVYTLRNGKRLESSGAVWIGVGGTGSLTVLDAPLIVQGVLHIAENGNSSGRVTIAHSQAVVEVNGNRLDLGRGNNGLLLLSNGTMTVNALTLFGDSGGDGVLRMENGSFTANGAIRTGPGTGAIDLNGGLLHLQSAPTERTFTTYNQASGAVLRIQLLDAGLTPLTVTQTATFDSATAILEIDDQRNTNGGTRAESVTWIAGTNLWDLTIAHWETTNGVNVLPADGDGAIYPGQTIPFLNASNILNASNLLVTSPGWAITNNGATNLSLVWTNAIASGGPILAVISNLGSVVLRTNLLHLSQTGPADGAGIDMVDGRLELTNATPVDMVLGGSANATVNQEGGLVHMDGNLIFGMTNLANNGGFYNLNGGTLLIDGNVIEQDPSVGNAQLQLNGGELQVAGTILVQRFAIAEASNAMVTYTASVPIRTTGTLAVGGDENAVGVFVLNDSNLTIVADNTFLGQDREARGTFLLENGTFENTGNEFRIAGNGIADSNTVGTLVIGTPGGPNSAVLRNGGGNTEIGQFGTGTLTMHTGRLEQIRNNIVVAQNIRGIGTVNMNGGVIHIGSTNPTTHHLNFNDGTGTFHQNGGLVWVEQSVQMGRNNNANMGYHLNGGQLSIGRNLDFRNNGIADIFNLAGGDLKFRGAASTIHYQNRTGLTNEFNFTSGRLANVRTFNGSLFQRGGLLDIGSTVGVMNISGDYDADSAATLRIEIDWDGTGVPIPGTNFDQMVVASNLNLNADAGAGSMLDLVIVNPAFSNAPPGTRIPIIAAGGAISGMFTAGTLIQTNGLDLIVDYGGLSNEVALVIGVDPLADTDGDGLQNLLEIGFGTDLNNPLDGPQALPYIVRGVSNINYHVTFRKLNPAGTLIYTVESSTNLTSWIVEAVATTVSSNQVGLPAGVERVEATFPSAGPDFRKYFRVGVEQP